MQLPRSPLRKPSCCILVAIALASPAAATDIFGVYAAELGVAVSSLAEQVDRPRDEPMLLALVESVAPAEMADMRAGFVVGGVTVGFGFDITTSVNGLPMQRLTMPIGGTVASVVTYGAVTGAAAAAALAGTGSTSDLVRASNTMTGNTAVLSVGRTTSGLPLRAESLLAEGAMRILTELSSQGATQLLANRADNQQVIRSATFEIELSGMRDMLARQAQGDVIGAALATRRSLGR